MITLDYACSVGGIVRPVGWGLSIGVLHVEPKRILLSGVFGGAPLSPAPLLSKLTRRPVVLPAWLGLG
ncbi:MAG: hypothetical protein QXR18_09360 [Pyrobaculum sp.]